MDLATYKIETQNTQQFDFVSVGKNGNIHKSIIFSLFVMKDLYNLSLCDVENGVLNDLSISDNGDTEKILATVAHSVFLFTANCPEANIYAKGSTNTRTRLYQMGLNKHHDEISLHFDVFGYKNGDWQVFEKNTNYEAFLIHRK